MTDDTNTPDDTASTSFADIFTVDFGADGPKDENDDETEDADAVTYALGISAPDADSGLNDSLTGDDILLRKISDTLIEGYLAGDPAEVAFSISVDANTGVVTQEQDRSVEHGDPLDDDESASPATLAAAGLITLTATATDGDDGAGDTASGVANIGHAFTFRDDGPSVSADGEIPTLVTDDTNTPDDTASTSFADIFTVDFGADGPKDENDDETEDADAVTYALGISAPDADSGLNDSLTGDDILLRKISDTLIEGYLAGDPAEVAFSISVDANTGVVTQEQDRSVEHGDPLDDDESASPATLAAAGLITLTATATDGDDGAGDTASGVANIGHAFAFRDDGPEVTATGAAVPVLETDDTNVPGDTDSADFGGLFTFSYGKDGPKDDDDNGADADAAVYALGLDTSGGDDSGLVDTLTGEDILLRYSGGMVEGYTAVSDLVAFTISIDSSDADLGSVVLELEQDRSIHHDNPLDPFEDGVTGLADDPATLAASLASISLSLTVKDGDDGASDTASASVDITDAFAFFDDGPGISPAIADGPLLAWTDGAYSEDSGFLDYGNDGAGSFTIQSWTSLADDTIIGPISETLSPDGTVLTYASAIEDLFSITLDGSGTGSVRFDVLSDAPLVLSPLDFSNTVPGGPSEYEVVRGDNTWVEFDGFLTYAGDDIFASDAVSLYNAGNLLASDLDDPNVSKQGAGVKDNQIDQFEHFKLSFFEPEADPNTFPDQSRDIAGFLAVFDGATGGASNQTFDIRIVAYDDGIQVWDETISDQPLPKNPTNPEVPIEFQPGVDFDEAYLLIEYSADVGMRLRELSLYERLDAPDFAFETTVRASDGDGDWVEDTFSNWVDGNGDGLFMA